MSKSRLTAWERWELASFDTPGQTRPHPLSAPAPAAAAPNTAPAAPEAPRLPTAAEIEAVFQQAREQGYAAGHAEGLSAGEAAGRQATEAQAQLLAEAIVRLDAAITGFDEQVSQEVLQLALEVARQIVRRSTTQQPDSLLAVISEALVLLPHQHASIYLHPEDAALVKTLQGSQLSHAGHRIHEDVSLSRGDCVIEAGNSRVDATLDTRWRRVVAALGSEQPLLTPDEAAGSDEH